VGLIAEVCGSVPISPCRSPRLSPCCFWPGLGAVARPGECLRRRPRRPTHRVGGYDIAAAIGDQFSDLDGRFTDRAFKLPNPMYFPP
jgi:hypothetical protein